MCIMFRKIASSALIFAILASISALGLYAAAAPAGDAADGQPLRGRIVILDPGHGSDGSPGYAGYSEHATMLKLAKKIRPLLEAEGATVIMTRESNYNVSYHIRVAMVNKLALETVRDGKRKALAAANSESETAKLQGDLREIDRLLAIVQNVIDDSKKYAPIYMNVPFDETYKRKIHPDWRKVLEYENDPEVYTRYLVISLHSNALPTPIDTSVNGANAYYASNSFKKNANYFTGYTSEDRSFYFGDQLLNNIAKLGIKKRGAEGSNYLMVREHNLPGVLVENGFHTNNSDREKLSSDAFLDKMAAAYCYTIKEYFTSYIGPLPETEEPPRDPIETASSWAREGIKNALAKGFVPEVLQNNYAEIITRAEFCTMAVMYIEYRTGKSIGAIIAERNLVLDAGVFTDTSDSYILSAYALGIIKGTTANTFTPNGKLNREQAATMLTNACRALGKNVAASPPTGFADANSASAWAVDAINYCVANGIMNGVGNNSFNPKAAYTREQAIVTFGNIP